MDDIDRAIIDQLLKDGRLSNNELADRIGLTPSPCLRRVRALQASGVLTGYHATVDPAAVGRAFQVLLHVEMAVQTTEVIEAFEERARHLKSVVHCRRMFGSPDYLLWIAVPDLPSYEHLYMSQLTSLPGVARTNSQFTMKTVKTLPGYA